MAESEEEIKSLLMKMKEESEKKPTKLNIQKGKIMVSCQLPLDHRESTRIPEKHTLLLHLLC